MVVYIEYYSPFTCRTRRVQLAPDMDVSRAKEWLEDNMEASDMRIIYNIEEGAE